MFQFALPRGERPRGRVPCWFTGWFQFALPRGERLQPVWRISTIRKFQFALPRGERRASSAVRREAKVSIRAPAWGATPRWSMLSAKASFQFALPRGERPGAENLPGAARGFNSRSRVGSDAQACAGILSRAVSIRAPAWGATGGRLRHASRGHVSIRAPAWGATQVADEDGAIFGVSIRAPAWGATRSSSTLRDWTKFQFALPRGERHHGQRWRAAYQRFNSRSRVGSD